MILIGIAAIAILLSIQINKIKELRNIIKYSKEAQLAKFQMENPKFSIIFPFGNTSHDYDGYIQYFSFDDTPILRLTWSHAEINPITKNEIIIDEYNAAKQLEDKGIKYKKIKYSIAYGFVNLLGNEKIPYIQKSNS